MLQLEQTITLFLLYLSDNFFRSLSSPLNPLLLVTTLMASPLSQPGVSIDFGFTTQDFSLNYSDTATHMLNEAGLRLWPLISYLVPVNVSGYFFEPGCCINAAFVACLLVF